MKHFFYLSAICVLVLASCAESFKKGGNGLEYKIISSGNGTKVSYGDYLQLHFTQRYAGTKDTIIGDSRDYMPRINILDSVTTPPEYFKILIQARKGDSIIIRSLVDSFYKKSPEQMPPFMKKGKFMYTTLKILNVFKSKEEADSANKAELKMNRPKMFAKQMDLYEKEVILKSKAQIDADSKVITDYLTKNNITATKTKWGTYIAVTNEGTGNNISFTDIATVNYTGKTLDSGRVFDSNLDPKFKHVEPLQVTMMDIGNIALGWTDALLHMKKGTKATIFLPSTLGFGPQGRAPEIGPNAILIFEMEVIGVDDQDDVMKRQEEAQKKMIESPNHVADSIKKAQGK
jgi:FKBP-type peptidyl-prolyl cis-trans isomerase